MFVTSYAFGDKDKPNYITKMGAFLWTVAKGFQPLSSRFEGHGVPCLLNDRGQIAGNGIITQEEARDSFAGLGRLDLPDTDGAFAWRAFLYSNGSFTRLPVPRSWSTTAQAINNRGDVLMNTELLGAKRAYGVDLVSGGLYLWRDGKATPVFTNISSNTSVNLMREVSLNDAGDVVATTVSGVGQARGFSSVLYRKGSLYQLDDCVPKDSGWHFTSVRQINNRGQIVGTGTYKDKQRAFLLSPVTR